MSTTGYLHRPAIAVLVFIASLLMPLLALAAPAAQPSRPSIVPGCPEILNFQGALLAPLEVTARALGAQVVVTADEVQATLPNGNSITINTEGKPQADVPTDATAQVKPVAIGETLYAHFKPLVEALGAKVELDAAKGLATVTLPALATPILLRVLPVATPLNRFSEDGVELYAIDLATRNQLRLSYGLAPEMDFALSTDGRIIAYTRGGHLYWRDAAMPLPHLLLEAVTKGKPVFYSHPAISPDGATLYCSRNTLNPVTLELDTDLISISADGTKTREWPGLGCPELSPDGKTLVYTRFPEDDDPQRLGYLSLEDGERHDLGVGYHPVFSPDGSKIVFTRAYARDEGATAWALAIADVTDATAGTCLELPEAQRVGKQVAGGFTPDGKRIVYEDRGKGLFIIEATLANARQLTKQAGDRLPLVSPDGKTLFFQRDENIYSTGINGGKEDFLSSGLSVIDFRTVADGKRLLCTARPLTAAGLVDSPFLPAPTDEPPIDDPLPIPME